MIVSGKMEGGRETTDVYNIELYGEKNIAKGKGIEVGSIVSTKGHVRMYSFVKEGETITNKAFQNPYQINIHTQEKAAEKKVSAKTNKTTAKNKSKPQG